MIISYEGKDIYPEVGVNRCCYDTYCGGRPDTLEIVFNDSSELWDGWSPEIGAAISAKQDNMDTGRMFVYSFAPENGLYTLRARSAPESIYERRTKSYEKVRFIDLLSEAAGRNDLTLDTYNVSNNLYGYVEQRGLSDAQLLQSRCMLEGYGLIISDGKLIVYDELSLENQTPAATLDVVKADDFYYTDNDTDYYGSCELTNGKYTGTYSAGSGRTLKRRCNLYAESDGEMIRYARGVLRNECKSRKTCVYDGRQLYDGIAAGSVVSLETIGAESWDGPAFVTHVRHDFVFMLSKIEARKPLGW